MSKLKTQPTEVSAESHIAAVANDEQRNDAQILVALAEMKRRYFRQAVASHTNL